MKPDLESEGEDHDGDQGWAPVCGGCQGDGPHHVVDRAELGREEPPGGQDGEALQDGDGGDGDTAGPVRPGAGEVGHDGEEEEDGRAAGEP